MNARLTICFADRPVLRVHLDPDSSYLLGRDAACDIRLADDRISRRHARLLYRNETWICEDLDSKNGLQVNGRTGAQHRLESPSWIDLGGVLAQFDLVTGDVLQRERETLSERRAKGIQFTCELDPAARLPDLLDGVLKSTISLSGTQRGFILLAGEADFELRAMHGLDADAIGEKVFTGSLSTVREVARGGSPAVVCDAMAVAQYGERASVIAGSIRAMLCLPLRMQGRIGGVIYADSREPGKVFDELDLELLTRFADQAAIAIGAAQLREDIAAVEQALERVRNVTQPAESSTYQESHWPTLGELLRTHAVGQ